MIKVDKLRGMDIIFVTTAKTDEEAKELLKLLGMPFIKVNCNKRKGEIKNMAKKSMKKW